MKKFVSVFAIVLFFASSCFSQGPLGNGADGALIINAGDTVIIDAVRTSVTGLNQAGTNTLTVTSAAGFNMGDEILIITIQDPETDQGLSHVGIYETKRIQSIAGSEFTLTENLDNDFDATGSIKHQVLRVPNYTNVTVDGLLTCSAWNGSTGGIIFFRATGSITVTNNGVISAVGKGYRGGFRGGPDVSWNAYRGESYIDFNGGQSRSAYYNGGGGGIYNHGGSGGGGGFASGGSSASGSNNGYGAASCFTTNWQDRLIFGGGAGGGAGSSSDGSYGGSGGCGGGIIKIIAKAIYNEGTITSNGKQGNGPGENGVWDPFPLYGYRAGAGGGGAGGTVNLTCIQLENTNLISTAGGAGGTGGQYGDGGAGSVGRIRLDYNTIVNDGEITPFSLGDTINWSILHENLTDLPDETGPYTIDADIYDIDGDIITSASVFYQIDGGSWTELPMSTAKTDQKAPYTADIPGQNVNTVIDYYLYATDGTDNYYLPFNAPADLFTFTISGYPPTGLVITDYNDGSVELNWIEPEDMTYFVDYTIHRSETENFVPGPGNQIATAVADTFYTNNGLQDFHTYYYKIAANFDFGGTPNSNYSEEASITANNTSITTITGNVFLEGQSNHANIKVRFVDISPAAELDSAYTNALGYFETTIIPGVYTIDLIKDNYQTYSAIIEQSIIDDLDIGEHTLQYLGNTNISGNVSGTWDGVYSVTGNITVPNGDSLIIEAGSEIRFLGNYHIYIYGYLAVNGTEQDPVIITSRPENQVYAAGQWQGIDFYDNSDDNSYINYAEIRYAVDGIYWENANASLDNSIIHHCSQYGLYMNGNSSSPHITNVELYNNSNHALYVYDGAPTLNYVNSHNNYSYGAYYNHSAYGSIKNSKFNNNSSHGIRFYDYGSPSMDSCEVKNNSSWGMRVDHYSSPYISNTVFSGNSGYGCRVNHDNNSWCYPRFINCIFENNTSYGISLYRYTNDLCEIAYCTIRENGASGIDIYYYSNANIHDNIINNNNGYGIYLTNASGNNTNIHHNIIAYNASDGIYRHSSHSGNTTLEYNTIYGNYGDGIEMNNTSGTLTITNNIVVNNTSYGIRSNVPIHTFEYNNVYENQGGAITNLGNMPADTWIFTSYNANNDTADNYLNFAEEPSFTLSDSLDFYLTYNSPCIDAGDPEIKDPDGTDSDVGAKYRNPGYPHNLEVVSYGDQTVTIRWDEIELDTLQSYNVYYQISGGKNKAYTFFGNTTDTELAVTGLTNNQLYDFTVTGVYPISESAYAFPVSEMPGVPQITFDPVAFNLTVDADTVERYLKITNTGSRDLDVDMQLGIDNGYCRLDGSGDVVTCGDQSHLSGMTALTLECWVYNNSGSWTEPCGKNYREYQMTMEIDNDRFGMYKGYSTNDQYQHYYGYYDFDLSTWYHLAVTWKGNTITFYVNGTQVNQYTNASATNIPNTSYGFEIGRRAGTGSYYLNGGIAEVRVWNIERTAEEIFRYKDSPLNGDEPGLFGYWPLHNDYNDHSSYGATGTPSGNTYINSGSVATLPELPFIIDPEELMLEPAEKDSILFKFYDTGEEGTFTYTTPVLSNDPANQQYDYELSLTYGDEVPSTPVHFIPVAETGIEYEIVVTDAEIDGNTISVGDEVGVFDDEVCVGAGLFDGSFNMPITCFGSPGKGKAADGYTEGNPISFKIYDTSADLEAVTEAEYYIGDGTFGYGEFSSVILTGTVYKEQEVLISAGTFNLISYNLLPRYTAATTVFEELDSLKIVYNDEGGALIPEYSINSIGDIDFRDGYHLFCTEVDTIFFEGISINPMEWDITVEAGKWNSTAFLGEDPLDITTAFPDTLIDSIYIVQNAAGEAWIPSLASNTIGNMQPGSGYQIFLDVGSDIVFNYQTTNGFAKEFIQSKEEPEYFEFVETGLPYIIVVDDPAIEDIPLSTGDEIAAFDGDVCVGAVVHDGTNRIQLTAWEKSEQYGLPGFTPYNPILIRIYSYASGYEYETELTSLEANPDNLLYNGGAFSHISVKGIDNTVVLPDISGDLYIEAYPNPFRDMITFKYSITETTDVRLEIFDITGRKITILENIVREPGEYIVHWKGTDGSGNRIADGFYQYSFETKDYKHTDKILLLK